MTRKEGRNRNLKIMKLQIQMIKKLQFKKNRKKAV